METTIVSLVRHGHVYNPQRIYYGRLPRFRLSENGRRQAAATAQTFINQQVSAVYSSPMLRARQTAQIIADAVQQRVHRSKRLLESYTPFDGQPFAVLEERRWDAYTGSPPEYEQPDDIVARMTYFIATARRKHKGGHIVAVTHADPVAFTALWAAARPISIVGRKQLRQIGLADDYPDHAAVLSLSFNGEGERPFQIEYRRPILESVKNNAG